MNTIQIIRQIAEEILAGLIEEGQVVSLSGNLARVILGRSRQQVNALVPRQVLLAPGDFAVLLRLRQQWIVLTGFMTTQQGDNDPYRTRYPRRVTLEHIQATVVSGNAILLAVNTSQIDNHWATQDPAANGDSFAHNFWLEKGSYTVSWLGRTASWMGMLDWMLDGVRVVTDQDWYSDAAAFNVVKTATITVEKDGLHTLIGKVNSKNASSSDYYIYLTKCWFS